MLYSSLSNYQMHDIKYRYKLNGIEKHKHFRSLQSFEFFVLSQCLLDFILLGKKMENRAQKWSSYATIVFMNSLINCVLLTSQRPSISNSEDSRKDVLQPTRSILETKAAHINAIGIVSLRSSRVIL